MKKRRIELYEEDHKKIKLLVQHNARYKTMADGIQHIIERYEVLVRPLRPLRLLSPDELEEFLAKRRAKNDCGL